MPSENNNIEVWFSYTVENGKAGLLPLSEERNIQIKYSTKHEEPKLTPEY